MLTWCMSHPWMTFFIVVLAIACIESCVVAIANAVISQIWNKLKKMMWRKENSMDRLKPCQFCGGEARLQFYEGEKDNEDDSTWGNPGWIIYHEAEENPDCPISDYAGIGTWIYETKEDAMEAWNRRTEEGTQK